MSWFLGHRSEVTCNAWHMKRDTWHLTHDKWLVTPRTSFSICFFFFSSSFLSIRRVIAGCPLYKYFNTLQLYHESLHCAVPRWSRKFKYGNTRKQAGTCLTYGNIQKHTYTYKRYRNIKINQKHAKAFSNIKKDNGKYRYIQKYMEMNGNIC